LCELGGECIGGVAASIGFIGQAFEAGVSDGAGDVVHSVVEPDVAVEVFLGFAVGSEEFDGACELVVVDGDHASFTGAEVFGGVEGVGAGIAIGTEAFAFVGGEVSLGSVVDDFEVVLFGKSLDSVDVDGCAVEMGTGDGFGVGCDSLACIFDVELKGVFSAVNEDGLAASGDDHAGGGDVGPCGDEDFVTGFEECVVGELEGAGAVGAGEGGLGVGSGSE